jgi:selenide,water dikinase
LAELGLATDERVLSGQPGDNPDAVVLRLPPGKALVQTVDFFTPIVNDPYLFGEIAAANALSDVYAVGGEPYAAMNIICFPLKRMPKSVLKEVLRGGLAKVREAGAVPAGGHSVEDDELKYGLAVSGLVDPAAIAANSGARPGDALVLTKPVGTGVLATALKGDWPGSEGFEVLLHGHCARLNKAGGEIIRTLGLRGATDVTGFGLGGHLLELARASRAVVELRLEAVPLLPQALSLAGVGLLPAGSLCNRNFYLPHCEVRSGLDPLAVDLAFDAQTSGGLILCLPEDRLDQARAMLRAAGDLDAVVGRVLAPDGGKALRIV